jgi:hypothetical protein
VTSPSATPAELARQRQIQQAALARVAAGAADEAWLGVDPGDIARSWGRLLERPLATTTGAQLLSAQTAEEYVSTVLAAEGAELEAAGTVVPRVFAGVASDGRSLSTLLYEPAIRTLEALQQGAGVERALGAGRLSLDMIVRTQVADAGRAATGTAIAARGGGYTRQLSPPSCSRCVILAGKWFRWNEGFDRHPRCDCVHVPSSQGFSRGLKVSARGYFDTLSVAEQDRTFTRAGAQAIRDGADPAQVVNARRGMQVAGGRLVTTESTSRSGVARRGRLMPEQIYADAHGDRDLAVRLLRQHGYLI